MGHLNKPFWHSLAGLFLLACASLGCADARADDRPADAPAPATGSRDQGGLLLGLRAPVDPVQLSGFKGYVDVPQDAGAGIIYRAELVAGGVSALIPLNPHLAFAADLGGSLDLNGLPNPSTALMNAAPLRLGPAAVTAYGASARYSLDNNWTTLFGIQHRAFEYGNGVTPLNNDGNLSTGVPSTERRIVFELRREF